MANGDGSTRLLQSDCHEPVNLGNPDEKTVLEAAQTVLRVTGRDSRIEHRDLPVDDPKVRQPDIGRARRRLDWTPTIDLEEGLRRTMEDFRRRIPGGRG